MRRTGFLLIVLLQFLVAGCALEKDDGVVLPEGITDVNQSLRLTLVEETFNVRTGTVIGIENVSQYALLYFSEDTGVYLYIFDEEKWVSVAKKEIIYIPSADAFLRQTTNQAPFYLTVAVEPMLPDLQKKTKLRALVIATVMENDQLTDEKVAAYIDLWVEP